MIYEDKTTQFSGNLVPRLLKSTFNFQMLKITEIHYKIISIKGLVHSVNEKDQRLLRNIKTYARNCAKEIIKQFYVIMNCELIYSRNAVRNVLIMRSQVVKILDTVNHQLTTISRVQKFWTHKKCRIGKLCAYRF